MSIDESARSVAGLAVLLVWTQAGCSGPPAVEARVRPDVPRVAVAEACRRDLARELKLASEFRPYQEVELHAKISGYLKAIYVDVGDRVRAGQPIALLEVPEMANQLAEVEAAVRASRLEVQRTIGEVKSAEAAHRIRSVSFDRLAGVAKERPNLIAQQEIDSASAAQREAAARLDAARAAQAAAEEKVRVASAKQDQVKTMMTYMRIVAPFDGVVTDRLGDPGAMVQAGTSSKTQAMPVVRLSQMNRLRLILPVPESVVPRIHIGTPVEVRVDSLKRVFEGTIARFTGELDESTRVMETEVDILNPDLAIKAGMYGYASLKLDRRENTIAIPVQAVASHDKTPTVLVAQEGGILAEQPVVLGLETPDFIEVLSGLREKDLVVLGNRSELKPGMHIETKLIEGPSEIRSH